MPKLRSGGRAQSRCLAGWLAGTLLLAPLWPAHAERTDVLVNNYDDFRTGANLRESTLNVANVRPDTFGRLFSYEVDGAVMSQPLVATNVDVVGRGRRDVVYVATLGNSVFAFDAQAPGPPLWHRALDRLPSGDAARVIGIYGTPVIDRGAGTLYVVAGLAEGSHARYVLHALDLSDGSERSAGPVLVSAGVQIDSSPVPFDPTEKRAAIQRAALAIAQGKVIIAFGGDYFEGWVFSYDKNDLRAAPAAFCTTCVSRVAAISKVDYLDPSCIFLGPGGGIWQSGRAPVVDPDGRVYFFTGNKQHIVRDGCMLPPSGNACAPCQDPGGCRCKGIGTPKLCRGPDTCTANQSADRRLFDVNEALIQLDPAQGLALTGWFRPGNWNDPGSDGLEVADLDLGSSGPLLIPGTTRLVGGGKQGVLYVIDTRLPRSPCVPALTQTCLGQASPNPIQSFQIAPAPPPPNEYYRHLFGGPILWNRPAALGGPLAFVWRENDYLRSYRLSDRFADCDTRSPAPTTTHNCSSAAQSEEMIDRHPGGTLALSANGADPASAIIWVSTNRAIYGPGKLMAFRAIPEPANPSRLAKLWDSDFCEEDRLDLASDFIPPTVANGKVYLATGASKVDVFGLMPPRECAAVPLPSVNPMLQ